MTELSIEDAQDNYEFAKPNQNVSIREPRILSTYCSLALCPGQGRARLPASALDKTRLT